MRFFTNAPVRRRQMITDLQRRERTEALQVLGFHSYQQYLTSNRWKVIRQKVLERDNFRCITCGKPASQVHHFEYNLATLAGEHLRYLQSTCGKCHKRSGHGSRRATDVRDRPPNACPKCGTLQKSRKPCSKCRKAANVEARTKAPRRRRKFRCRGCGIMKAKGGLCRICRRKRDALVLATVSLAGHTDAAKAKAQPTSEPRPQNSL